MNISASLVARSLFVLFCLCLPAFADESLIHEGDKIIFVGDSITGQGTGPNGYVGLMREALTKVHANTKTTLTPLGGSGHTVGSWTGIEKNSREKHFNLDAKDIDVKATLDGGADVVVIMLGMNNVLRPDMDNSAEGIVRWSKTYRDLITALRDRTHARVIALATPTLCTEDVNSAKNKVMDEMSKALVQLASEEKCAILPVREEFKNALKYGRDHQWNYHLTNDFVHPTSDGHFVMAHAMLKGLGEFQAADEIERKRNAMVKVDDVVLSFTVEPIATEETTDEHTIRIYYCRSKRDSLATGVDLKLPEGWKKTSDPSSGLDEVGEITVAGRLDHLQTKFQLVMTDKDKKVIATRDIIIPAPWLVGAGHNAQTGWVNQKGFTYSPAEGRLPIDADLSRGIGFDKPVGVDPKWSPTPVWKRYIPSINYTGGNDPGSVDFCAIAWYRTFDVGYGVRWIYSPTDRTLPIHIDSDAFTSGNFLTVWINGQTAWESALRKGDAQIKLQKGWNALVFKSNHLEWQWQFDLRLMPTATDDLSDLRFSIRSHDIGSAK